MENLYKVLDELNIKYEKVEHPAVFTVEEVHKIDLKIEGVGCKNLFLTDKNGKYFLVVLEENKRADLKELTKLLKVKKLSFASEEELKELLGLTKGSCTPMGIINDKENKVVLLLDQDLIGKRILCHPNRNTATISIDYADLIKFIGFENHIYINFI